MFPPGFSHSTVAMPEASTVISKVVPPRPATLPVHCTCVPMSVHSGAFAPPVTKCPLCANATPGIMRAITNTASGSTNRLFNFSPLVPLEKGRTVSSFRCYLPQPPLGGGGGWWPAHPLLLPGPPPASANAGAAVRLSATASSSAASLRFLQSSPLPRGEHALCPPGRDIPVVRDTQRSPT